jgi:hypothetical protein
MSERELTKLQRLIHDLTDPDDCWFDHNGGCQAHGYLSLKPGEMCPQQEAKEWLAASVIEGGA